MKHLKPFKESKVKGNIYKDLIDICLELNDEGFDTNVQRWEKYIVIKRKNLAKFKYSDISEVVERMRDYMNQSLDCETLIYYTGMKIPVSNPSLDDDVSQIGLNFVGVKFIYPFETEHSKYKPHFGLY